MTWASLMADGTMAFRNGVPSLREMQEAVGGLIAPVEFELAGAEATMFVNDEGKLVDRPVRNWKADVLCPLAGGDWTAGDVVFTGGVGPGGETLALSDAQVAELRRVDRDVHVLLLDDDASGVAMGR
jgi:hypothetical protein